jgi:uncharacterized protein (TIGR00266 family)
MGTSLQHRIDHRPDFAMLTMTLRHGEQVFAEPASMIAMDPSVTLKAGLRGGLLKSLGRGLGGESLIINTYTAHEEGAQVAFAPGPMGDMQHYALNNNRLILQRGAFVAHSEGVEVDGKWGGFKGMFSGEGMVLLQAQGTGDIFFSTYGAMVEVDVRGGYFVDTGYIVAFEDTLDYNVTVLPGLGLGSKVKSFLFGGEGFVCRFEGHGKVWVQTRAVNPYLSFIHPFRPVKQNQG